ncbi:hypothetical protein [Cytobacillus firmus]|uniref:hypothetical protein n=1 Tax=Cytobacillus firmus TaxID=1399 RepID=UPI0018CCD8DC|nr:hypothetical protein [Cytobacillus firmus]MBG9657075.1 hypothetical protein [Cytobacillus firmus]MED1906748.1 hypothetical protein [Cytobacillus firmus]
MDMIKYRIQYLQELMEQMNETTDNQYLFELYKESNRTYRIVMSELLTKEKEPVRIRAVKNLTSEHKEDIKQKWFDATDGEGATVVKLDDLKKRRNRSCGIE